MSVYLYTLRKLARPIVVKDETGADVVIEATLKFATPNATSDDFQRKVERLCDGAIARMGDSFRGLVVREQGEEGTEVIAWDGAPYWFDTDRTPGKTAGFLLKHGRKRATLYHAIKVLSVEVADGASNARTLVPGRGMVSCVRMTLPADWPTPKGTLFAQTFAADSAS